LTQESFEEKLIPRNARGIGRARFDEAPLEIFSLKSEDRKNAIDSGYFVPTGFSPLYTGTCSATIKDSPDRSKFFKREETTR
jgi:hypothetical protein